MHRDKAGRGRRSVRTSAHTLVEIDNLGPIHPGVDEAHRTAFRAAEVGGDIVPVPVWQVAKPQPAVVVASLMIALQIGRAEAKDQDRFEAGIPFDGAFPVLEPVCRFAAPGHDAEGRQPRRIAKSATG